METFQHHCKLQRRVATFSTWGVFGVFRGDNQAGGNTVMISDLIVLNLGTNSRQPLSSKHGDNFRIFCYTFYVIERMILSLMFRIFSFVIKIEVCFFGNSITVGEHPLYCFFFINRKNYFIQTSLINKELTKIRLQEPHRH